MDTISGFLKRSTFKSFTLLLIITTTKQIVTIICAATVANAAPNTPKAGIEPNPKINNGSNIILNNNPIVLIINGVLLSPDPLNIAVKTGLIK